PFQLQEAAPPVVADTPDPPPPAVPVAVERSEQLARLFDQHNYTLKDVAGGRLPVPAIALMRMPPDLAKVADTDKRKRLFIKALLPVLLQANEEIAADRRHLQKLR